MGLGIIDPERASRQAVIAVAVGDGGNRRFLLNVGMASFRSIFEGHDSRISCGVGLFDRYGLDPVCGCGKDKSLGGFELRHVISAGRYPVSTGNAFCVGGQGGDTPGRAVVLDSCLCMGFGIIDPKRASRQAVIAVAVGDGGNRRFLLYACVADRRGI